MSSRAVVKAKFETGDVPTQADFGDLIDSLAHVSEDDLATSAAVEAAAAAAEKFAIVTDATAARTLALADAHKYLRFSNAAAVTVTVPPQADVAWQADSEIVIEQAGAGQVTVAAGAGVTIRNRSDMTLKTAAQYSAITLKRVATDEWVIGGDREAA